ncbi:gluconokinase [Uniformispora flossi]|uniref:gluconokinase n=1 Tax=Uniformispora flossi TaxID=3390723 RepID=UPI003C2AB441
MPHAEAEPPTIVVMGVSGTGKTTVARLLAERLGVPFADADDFHPRANIVKMSAGIPLDDADRRPWLQSIGRKVRDCRAAGTGCVIACSALKRSYRDILRDVCPGIWFVHPTAPRDVLAARIARRTDHFMPVSLLDSQLTELEPLGPDEHGVTLDAGPPLDVLVTKALQALPYRPPPPAPA